MVRHLFLVAYVITISQRLVSLTCFLKIAFLVVKGLFPRVVACLLGSSKPFTSSPSVKGVQWLNGTMDVAPSDVCSNVSLSFLDFIQLTDIFTVHPLCLHVSATSRCLLKFFPDSQCFLNLFPFHFRWSFRTCSFGCSGMTNGVPSTWWDPRMISDDWTPTPIMVADDIRWYPYVKMSIWRYTNIYIYTHTSS